jgi:hypothetical protein
VSPPCSIVRAILNHMRHAALAQNPFAARFPPLVQANPEISATMAWQFLGSTALRLTISAVHGAAEGALGPLGGGSSIGVRVRAGIIPRDSEDETVPERDE